MARVYGLERRERGDSLRTDAEMLRWTIVGWRESTDSREDDSLRTDSEMVQHRMSRVHGLEKGGD